LELAIAPAAGAPASKWIPVATGHEWPDKPRWAPDGKMLYFVSRQHTSFFNLWGTRFDADSGKPVGQPFMITHFDSPGLMISPDVIDADLGISARRAVFTMATVSGNLWMLDNVDR
jgi:hypothetical protein